MKFSQDIQDLLRDYTGQPLSIEILLERTGEHGFGMISSLLTLPFLIPVPLVGISTLLSLGIILLGGQLALGFHRPWLPQRVVRLELSPALSAGLLTQVSRVLRPLEKLVQPRWLRMSQHAWSRRLAGLGIAWVGLLMALPLPIPFTNLIPAWTILALAIGILEFDGLLILLGYGMVTATTLFFASLATAIWALLVGVAARWF